MIKNGLNKIHRMDNFDYRPWLMLCCLLLLSLLSAMPVQARPFLWKIESGHASKPSWVFGTIHVRSPQVNQLPDLVRDSISKSDVVVTEIPFDAIDLSSATQATLLPAGQRLQKLLPAKLWNRLDQRLKKTNSFLSAKIMDQFKIWASAVTLMTIADELKYPGLMALDMQLASDAKAAGKKTDGLETFSEQLAIFDDLSIKEQIQMLADTLDVMDRAEKQNIDPIKQLEKAWLSGDPAQLQHQMDLWQGDNQKFNQKINQLAIYNRNQTMANRIAKKIRQQPAKSFFFAVGAGHLIGKQPIQAYLKQMGYRLQRL